MLTGLALVGLVALGFVRYLDGLRPIEWKEFSRAAVQSTNAKGRNVLVSFSADWTLSARMQESGNNIKEVVVKSGKYRNKNNPAVESLTQAQRNVVYAVRDHAFFQDQFALEIVNE